jgi:hypothetical protein
MCPALHVSSPHGHAAIEMMSFIKPKPVVQARKTQADVDSHLFPSVLLLPLSLLLLRPEEGF